MCFDFRSFLFDSPSFLSSVSLPPPRMQGGKKPVLHPCAFSQLKMHKLFRLLPARFARGSVLPVRPCSSAAAAAWAAAVPPRSPASWCARAHARGVPAVAATTPTTLERNLPTRAFSTTAAAAGTSEPKSLMRDEGNYERIARRLLSIYQIIIRKRDLDSRRMCDVHDFSHHHNPAFSFRSFPL